VEVTVNGKRVVLRDKITTRDWDGIKAKWDELSELGFDKAPWQKRVALFQSFVESWEFAGDPQDVDAWGDLDRFDEELPLQEAIFLKFLQPKFERSKNLVSGFTTPSEGQSEIPGLEES